MSTPFLLLLLAGSGTAGAQAFSADTVIVEPSFSAGEILGVDSARLQWRGAWQLGSFVQYEQDPMILYRFGAEEGVILENRALLQSGFSYDWSPRISTRIVVPVSYQAGTEVPELAAQGVGLRDPRIGGRVALASAGPLTTALRTDLYLPIGTKSAWIGEKWPRASFSLLGLLDFGRPQVLFDLGILARAPVDTSYDFVLDSEILASAAARYSVWPNRVALTSAIVTRGGFSNLWLGGGENPVELLGGLQVQPTRHHRWDLGLGKGIADGYGTTTIRAFLGLTWMDAPPPPAGLRPVVAITTRAEVREVEEPTLIVEDNTPAIEWKEGELARIEKMEITIREPIQFEFARPVILPESMPTLHAVAGLLTEYWQIAHLVVVGHASEEGDFQYNYELSLNRCRAVYQALVEAGVDPARLSFRPMGEVEPSRAGTSEADLAANRRVEFRIVELLQPLDPKPPYATETLLPWTGQPIQLKPTGERILGATEENTVVAPSGDKQAVDILQQYLKEDESGAPPDAPPAQDKEEKK